MNPYPANSDNRCDITIRQLLPGTDAEELVMLFENIAAEENWKPDTAIRDYVGSSTYLAAFSEGELVGGIQVVRSSSDAAWWPSRTVWPECDPGSSGDIGPVMCGALEALQANWHPRTSPRMHTNCLPDIRTSRNAAKSDRAEQDALGRNLHPSFTHSPRH
jgi:hypothetical protein